MRDAAVHVIVTMPDGEGTQVARLLAAALPGARVDDARCATTAPEADYVVTGHRDAKVFEAQHALKAIFALGAGVGHLLTLPNLPPRVPLIRLEDAGMAAQMARYVLAAALRFAQRLDVYARQQRERQWRQLDPRSPATIKAGVLGMGVIGTQIAQALAAQGFRVRGHARTRKVVAGIECCAGGGELDAFLTGLDLLVAIVPLTPATTGMLDRRALALCADGAHVINIGRGALVVDDDLLALLDEGKLSGATLDVFRDEPLPADHPYWTCPGVAVTPHVAGVTLEPEAIAQIAAKIDRIERGLPVTGVVDRTRGY